MIGYCHDIVTTVCIVALRVDVSCF